MENYLPLQLPLSVVSLATSQIYWSAYHPDHDEETPMLCLSSWSDVAPGCASILHKGKTCSELFIFFDVTPVLR